MTNNFSDHRSQLREACALTFLGILQVISSALFLHDSVGLQYNHQSPVVYAYFIFARYCHGPIAIFFAILTISVWGALLMGRSVPRLLFDFCGGWYIFKFIFGFLVVNALLFTPAVSPHLLLWQIVAYIPFFIVTWGWIFWRVDFVGRSSPQQVIALPDALEPITSFDYYHSSLLSLVNKGTSSVKGVSRHGRLLVACYSLMLLDLLGVFVARAYGLIQKVI